jgi:hypothetical protein
LAYFSVYAPGGAYGFLANGPVGWVIAKLMPVGEAGVYTAVAEVVDLQPDDDPLAIGCGQGAFLDTKARHVRRVVSARRETRMIPVPIATLGRAFAIAACLAVAACQSTLTPSPSAVPSSTAPSSPSDAAAPLDTATPPAASASAVPTASFPPPPTSASAVPTASVPQPSLPPPTSRPTPKATAATVPAKPTGVTFTTDSVELPRPTGADEIEYQVTHTVRWKAPRTEGVEIRVYGVTECLSEPSNPPPGTSGPCLVEHTLLPPSAMALAATAPAAAGEISWIAPRYWMCAGPPVGPDGLDYQAIVIAAYNAAGHSIFAIADPGEWWRAGPGEMIC